jgi:hypothetical protein
MAFFIGLVAASLAHAADLRPIKTQQVKDVTVTLLSEAGQWKPGRNKFVLEFTSPDRKPVAVRKASLTTSMPMAGMKPMVANATLDPDGPGRYRGTIAFPDAGARQVTVTWDGPAGKDSTEFNVPVR